MTEVCELKSIPAFPDYEITKEGRVWSRPRNTFDGRMLHGKWLKPWVDTPGYWVIDLRNDGKTFHRYVHRLVLETFVGPCPQEMECCHGDRNRLNCNLNNLRWGTRSENRKDAINHGTHKNPINPGETNPRAILSEQDVRTIIYIHRTRIMIMAEIAKLYNVSRSAISEITNKRNWKHLWVVPQ